MNAKSMLLWMVCFSLTGCTQPLRFLDSDIETPSGWHTFRDNLDNWDKPLIVDNQAQVEQRWWQNFQDPHLDQLIEIALMNNKTLGIAATRVEEAKAARLYAFSLLMPQFSANGDASRGNHGFYTGNRPVAFEDLNVQVNWELDLFGKNQARLAAAKALVENEEILRQGVIVSLLAEVARNYFDLRNYERQYEITQENLATQNRTLELTIEQFKGAFASDFDVQRSAAQVSVTESRLPVLKISIEMARNRLEVLLGSTPGEHDGIFDSKSALHPLDPSILIAAPATVLGTRPDVRAAERRFAASISTYYAAKREWFPTISLVSFYGLQAVQGLQTDDNPDTPGAVLKNVMRTWNVMGSVSQPLLNFGRIQSDIDTASARQKRAYLEYQEIVLEALEDMENALANYFYETVKNVSLTNAANQNRKAVDLANQQFVNGFTPLLDVLVVQRNALETESIQAESDYKLRKDLVNIYTAAGGGWAY